MKTTVHALSLALFAAVAHAAAAIDCVDISGQSGRFVVSADENWVPVRDTLDIAKGSALDFTTFAGERVPAGACGRVVAKGDRFEFENRPGVAQRFYGPNLCYSALYLPDEESTALADLFIDSVAAEDERISGFSTRLNLAFSAKISSMESRVEMLADRILHADPRNVLKRGYTLVTDASGVVLKSASSLKSGERLKILFSDGSVDAVIE